MALTENSSRRDGIRKRRCSSAAFILLEAALLAAASVGQSRTLRRRDDRHRARRRRDLFHRRCMALSTARNSRAAFWLILAAAILFRLTLWPLAPTLSNDLYRYRWDGRVQLEGGIPTSPAPNDPRLHDSSRCRESNDMRMPAREIPTIYPPLAELVFRTAARFLRTPWRSSCRWKPRTFSHDSLAVWLRCAGGRAYQLAIYAWNPLVMVEFAGSGHSDALALVALVGAFVIIKSRPSCQRCCWPCAALLKSFLIMLFPLWLWRQGWPRSGASVGERGSPPRRSRRSARGLTAPRSIRFR